MIYTLNLKIFHKHLGFTSLEALRSFLSVVYSNYTLERSARGIWYIYVEAKEVGNAEEVLVHQ